MGMWGPYVRVADRKIQAKKEMEQQKKKGKTIEPVEINGRQIAQKFWGKKWCDHLESFADYSNRLPRGRTYVRNGSVCHLSVQKGSFEARVSGSSLYKVKGTIKALPKNKWDAIKKRCSGQIGSMLELLQGKFSHHVMEIVADHKEGLFPNPREMEYECDCPDWADMCKHVAAVLYGIGNRLDHRPELLFLLRGVDASELVTTQFNIDVEKTANQLDNDELGNIFGIDFETGSEEKLSKKAVAPKKVKKDTLNLETLTGKKLQAFREKRGFTVLQFAEVLGVTSASIYRWEQTPGILKLNTRSKEAFTKIL